MPRLILDCHCLERLVCAAARTSAHCRTEGDQLIVTFPHVNTHFLGIHVDVVIALHAGSDATADPNELVLHYHVHRIGWLPHFLAAWLADWAASRFVTSPVLRIGQGRIYIRLDRLQMGSRALPAVVHVAGLHVPDGAAAGSLTFQLKE
ncbi:MAG: hypothetical protein NTW87_07165 [Planctomycetota bacterium]|nr:hypothetical protein [Planctomycetota bacterium]